MGTGTITDVWLVRRGSVQLFYGLSLSSAVREDGALGRAVLYVYPALPPPPLYTRNN